MEQVAQGREDYYAGEGEAPGAWTGSGAAALGLAGEVDEDGLSRLLRSEDPATGEALRRPFASGAVAGFDVTFRAPKSVGVLWGVAEANLARQVRLGHETAVAGALGYLEREACRARRGAGGAIRVKGEGSSRRRFGIARPVPGIRCCTRMSWWRTRRRVRMGAGRRWMAVTCTDWETTRIARV